MPYLVTVILATVTGTTYISGPSISIEGKNIWILKCIPVKASEVLKGKLLSHLVPTVPVTLVASILFIIAIPMNALEIVAIILIPQLTNLFCALIGLLSNLFFGRLDYPSEARAIKSASTALVPMLSTAALAIAPAVLYFKVFKPQGITFAHLRDCYSGYDRIDGGDRSDPVCHHEFFTGTEALGPDRQMNTIRKSIKGSLQRFCKLSDFIQLRF